jgi:ABC-type dipeptide/oligopeptide/nickel transport system ATPase subunit
MPSFDIVRKTEAKKTFRVASIMGNFDLQSEKAIEHFKGEINLEQDWNIGVIYGASGTGKSTIAKELFQKDYIDTFKYGDEAIIDEMPKECSVDLITSAFNSVGFGTVWSWLKSYEVLSTGEKMRVNIARAILEKRNLIVFDEYTSTVNREVAKHGSFALQKAIRKMNKQFIAVSCHKDVLEWLEPDWTFCTDDMSFKNTRGLLRRPEIKLEIFGQKGMWDILKMSP